jgi:CRISPR/Cas system-associated exonuclease Cas4 (RecB family)
MKTFLEYVAADILAKHGNNLARTAVVFPNKRASLFMNEHLARLAAGRPIWSPAYITISDLFRQHSKRKIADPVKLVCELYRSYTVQTGIDETLDHFYGWGQLLLADFDDLDKQMADADRVLANVADLREMDDDSFLTEQQKEVLKRFFSNFTDSHSSELRQRFIRLWSRMRNIYHDFNDRLKQQGLAYEGALYKDVVSSESLDLDYDTYIFVGFNVLLGVEHRLFKLIQHEGKARFYWDFDNYYVKRKSSEHLPSHANEAGHFIAQYLEMFPNELDSGDTGIYDSFSQPKHITIASASTENIQARYAATWLKDDARRIADGRATAIVLCNEGLLPTIIHCLPQEVTTANITTGYPLAQSPVASLVTLLIALRRDGYDHQREYFRLRQVKALLRHPYMLGATPYATMLLDKFTKEHNYYPTRQQLCQDALTERVFGPIPPQHDNATLLKWLCDIIQAIAQAQTHRQAAAPTGDMSPLKGESLFRAYTLLNRLQNLAQDGDLNTDIVTLGRLTGQLMQQASVPFHGEPAEGVQVMGILETRNLDFKHVLILSAQEGNMPRGTADTSFIPYSLRRAYGLTTQDHKVALYSYYFHRLLQRAEDITIVYNDSTADGMKGEMSRFLLQLMVECPHTIDRRTLTGGLTFSTRLPQPVENRATLPELLTPTAINRYMRCPLQFHYCYVEGLREPDEEDDTIDNRIFGNIFHDAAQAIYTPLAGRGHSITASEIDRLLKTNVEIERAVDEAFNQHVFGLSAQQQRRRPRLGGMQIISRQVIIHYLRQLLTLDRQLTPFTILALEEQVETKLTLPGLPQEVNIGGRIDRLDMITDSDGQDHIRVIDYKTGAQRLKPLADVDAVFSQDSLKEHSDYYLQTMLYSAIVAQRNAFTPVAPALLFIQHAAQKDYDPVLRLGKTPISDIKEVSAQFMQQLKQVIAAMYDHSQPLTPTADTTRCRYCPYNKLCY